jgi:D-tagatose-1,6-bisphosphate aldolase subunit GatZ/KbaZ
MSEEQEYLGIGFKPSTEDGKATMHPLRELLDQRKAGRMVGMYSACTAHPLVIEAVIEKAIETGTYALIEATANQVNQFGGYTGMTPVDFAQFVRSIADGCGLPHDRLILGGDHLGPLVWKEQPLEEALAKAKDLIAAYVKAGFTKIHLDTSMKLGDDSDDWVAGSNIGRRAAVLARVGEETNGHPWDLLFGSGTMTNPDYPIKPVYVIGSEVPTPGGAQDADESIQITTPESLDGMYDTFKWHFRNRGVENGFARIIAVVVQPGVEFSDTTVTAYDREKAADLCAALKDNPGLAKQGIVFEGHSTDYQSREHLKQMVEDGIAILKVGPALTFALREALFALSDLEDELALSRATLTPSDFKTVLIDAMKADSTHWKDHYHGTDDEIEYKLKYSYSDRCRYYLPLPEVEHAMDVLIENIDSNEIPFALLEKHMPIQYQQVKDGVLPLGARELIKDRIKDCISDYLYAVNPID